ncbi:MAG TPA: 30S ribosomal protein S12 methylthiotransferase RimO, partial [Gammaproteobacteria bacterium]|nr:30S ribosomal protein S12 methylthiotransferase RimO [Gammaproteobacteria bacterium]
EIDVIVDELDGEQALGRSMADAPEIDGRVYLSRPGSKGASKLKAGTIVTARVTDADEYDLWAEPTA